MKLRDPRITVQNTDGNSWQVTAEGLSSGEHGLEAITFTVLLPRSNVGMGELTNQAVRRAIELLQQHLETARTS